MTRHTAHLQEHADGVVLVTGATGLLGSHVVRRWAMGRHAPRIAVLVRDVARWTATASRLGIGSAAVMPLEGDLMAAGLGLSAATRWWLAHHATAVVHLAADTSFSRPLDEARAVNVDGTQRLLDVVGDCPRVSRVALVSTAFVAGRRTGRIGASPVTAADAAAGWVNAYEQSKTEAEWLVRARHSGAVVLRSSTVACDDLTGVVTQRNAVHRALRLLHDGLAPMIPGVASTAIDLVPADYVADAIARLALRGGIDGETLHLCAGAGAMPLDEMLEASHACWTRDTDWRRRGVTMPTLGDLETWDLFARSVEETGHARLRSVTRALAHFLPQLALPKQFDTSRTEALLGEPAPFVRDYWTRMVEHLRATEWRGVAGLAELAA